MSYLTAASAGLAAAGAYSKARAQKAALGYEAAVADNNAQIAEWQAQAAIENGQAAEQASRLKTAAMFGDQRAAMAANGVDLGTGSATEVLATTKFMGERDALTIRDNSARQAWALRNQAQGYASEAEFTRSTAAGIKPLMSAATSLMGSGAQVAPSWYKYNKAAGEPTDIAAANKTDDPIGSLAKSRGW